MNLNEWATLTTALVIFFGAIGSWLKWARPFLSAAKKDLVSGRDALLGRDAIHDTITGREIAPALPGMGIRMDRNEHQMDAVVDAVAQIAPALLELAESHKRLDDHRAILDDHRAILDDHGKRIDANAKEIADLRNGYIERIVSRTDSEAAFRAIEAVANNNGTDDSLPSK